MLVAVRAVSVTSPEAVLAQLVIVALLAAVAETHHTLTAAEGAFYRMEDIFYMGESMH